MNGITFSVRKSGDHVHAAVAPSNRSAKPRFGMMDLAIIAFFALSAASLIWLVVR
jgi:hypothetical protein